MNVYLKGVGKPPFMLTFTITLVDYQFSTIEYTPLLSIISKNFSTKINIFFFFDKQKLIYLIQPKTVSTFTYNRDQSNM